MDKIFYNNNPQVRAPGVQQNWTQEMKDEYLKCEQDPEYFIEHYVKIGSLDSEKSIKFDLRPYQKRIVDTIHKYKYTVCCLPRQCGKTTTVGGWLLHQMTFKNNCKILLAAHVHSGAIDFMERIKLAYEELPFWLKKGVKTYNELSIVFENGSRIKAAATTKNTGRGGSFNIVVVDEYAHIERNIADPFFASIRPTIASGKDAKMIIISTPKGLNHFHTLWKSAENNESDFKTVRATWNEVPGRDEEFKRKVIAEFGETKWRQEFECEFLGSSNTLISSYILEQLVADKPIKKLGNLTIYDTPKPDHRYFMTADTSRGKGLDYSAFIVFDITTYPYKTVAVFRDDSIVAMSYPNQIYSCARLYNNAPVLVEINDVGSQVADILQYELEYENVLGTSTAGRAGQVLSASGDKLGLYMTSPSKRIGCSALKALLENHKLIVNDKDVIDELRTFILSKETYKAEEGFHDDTTMCLVSFAWAVQQPYFKDLTESDIRKSLFDTDLERIKEELVPFGFILDGFEEPQAVKLDDSGDSWYRIDDDFKPFKF